MTDTQHETGINFSDELSEFDYLMFRGESNPRTRSTMLAVLTLESTPNFDRVKRTVDRASRVFIRLRQRVVEPDVSYVPARWAIDPDFDLDYHLRRVRCAAPGSQQQLHQLANQLNATPFDTCRPLWEMTFVEGLKTPGSTAALIVKMHHAVSDGIGALKLFKQLFDFDPAAAEPEMPLLPIPEDLSPELATKRGTRNLIRRTPKLAQNMFGKGVKLMSDGLRNPADLLSDAYHYKNSAQRMLGEGNLYRSPLFKGRSLSRNLGTLEIPLRPLKETAKAIGVSVNDAFLASVSLGLAHYHQAKQVDINQLSISMPVSTRPSEASDGGNHFSGAKVNLPLGETDPIACLREVSKRGRKARKEPALNLLNLMVPAVSRISTRAMHALADKAPKPEIQLSNVQGYPISAFLAGSKIVQFVPFGPVPNVAAMITMVSHDGTCFVGTHADSAAIDDFQLLQDSLEKGFEQIIDISKRAKAKKKTAKKTPKNKAAKKAKRKSSKSLTPKEPSTTSKKSRPTRRAKKKVKKVSAKRK